MQETHQFFQKLMSSAIAHQASDVHLENKHDGMMVRFRIHGKLWVIDTVSSELAQAIILYFKHLLAVRPEETGLAYDGEFSFIHHHQHYDVRAAILPTLYGDNITLRIFPPIEEGFTLDNLGFSCKERAMVDHLVALPYGLVLLCGATGTGKSSTLCALLKHLSSPACKIITIEDPVEYKIPGIIQTQVNEEIGLTFSKILKSVLRQSPNILMIGEIRDQESAQLTIQAALTGHLVLSTIHCERACDVVMRLQNLNISPFLIQQCLQGAIAQTLIPIACPYCRPPHLSSCPHCHGTGVVGRHAQFDIKIFS